MMPELGVESKGIRTEVDNLPIELHHFGHSSVVLMNESSFLEGTSPGCTAECCGGAFDWYDSLSFSLKGEVGLVFFL